MTENEMKAACIGILTYCQIVQTREPPAYDDDGNIECAAVLDEEAMEKTLEILSMASTDEAELFSAEDDE
jgi:hypothetical protein